MIIQKSNYNNFFINCTKNPIIGFLEQFIKINLFPSHTQSIKLSYFASFYFVHSE